MPNLTAAMPRQHQGIANTLGLSVTDSESKFGYAFGGGLEYAFLGNWTAEVEYLFVDLGATASSDRHPQINLSEHVVRAGVNYKFARWRRLAVTSGRAGLDAHAAVR